MGWTFWLGWVFLTALGFGVGSIVANAIARPMPERLHHVIGWSVAGACVGALQWVALRRRLTAAGWLLGILLFAPGGAMLYGLKFAVTRVREDPMSGIYNGAAVGASIGLV